MASQAAKAADRANGGDLREHQAGQLRGFQNSAAADAAQDKVVATITKNGREQYRVLIRTFKGRTFADIRVFAANGEGAFIPTGKGVTVKPEAIADIAAALIEAGRLLGVRS